MAKKYYWLKLKEDFFREKEIKKLRRLAGGDTYTIIYLKMMLLSLNDNGILFFDGVEDDFCDELALEIDEDTENVRFTIMYLLKVGLIEEVNSSEMFLTKMPELIGSETDKAALMRKKRQREKLVNGNNVTRIGNDVTEVLPPVTFCYTEKERDKEKEIEREIDITHFDKQNGFVDSFEPTQPEQPPKERIAYKKIQDAYNATCVDLPTCRSLSEARKKAIAARYHSGYSFDDFVTLFKKAQASSFLKGKNNRNWSANFDWLIKDANMAKVLDGNYDDHDAPNYKKSDLDDLF